MCLQVTGFPNMIALPENVMGVGQVLSGVIITYFLEWLSLYIITYFVYTL